MAEDKKMLLVDGNSVAFRAMMVCIPMRSMVLS